MLQIRLKEGSDKRWFNPSRDMVNVWPMLLRKSLQSFDNFEGVEGCTRDQMLDTASKLGTSVVKIIKEPVDHEMASAELQKITDECPKCMDEISRVAFRTLHGVYAAWVADAKPKTETDSDIPTVGLDVIAEKLARGKANPNA